MTAPRGQSDRSPARAGARRLARRSGGRRAGIRGARGLPYGHPAGVTAGATAHGRVSVRYVVQPVRAIAGVYLTLPAARQALVYRVVFAVLVGALVWFAVELVHAFLAQAADTGLCTPCWGAEDPGDLPAI